MAAKKKTSPWVWVLVGCGGMVVVVGLLFVAGGFFVYKKGKEFAENPEILTANAIALASPDLELEETDKESRQFKFRHLPTEEQYTVGFDQLADGKLTIRNQAGEVVFSADANSEDGTLIEMKGKDGDVTIQSNEQGGATVTSTDADGNVQSTNTSFTEDGMTIENSDGSSYQVGGNVDVSQFPDWVPRWGGNTMQGTSIMRTQGQLNASYQFHHQGTMKALEDQVKSDMAAANMTATMDTKTQEGMILNFEGESGRTLMMMAQVADQGGYDVAVNFVDQE